MQTPTIRDVYRARKTIAPYFRPTPLQFSMGLSEYLDAEVYIKHEEHLPLGAFKSRGGINLLANLTPDEKQRGLITSSTGNHGQSIASAGREFGVRVLIGLPENANPVKVAAMRSLGSGAHLSRRDLLMTPGNTVNSWPGRKATATCMRSTNHC